MGAMGGLYSFECDTCRYACRVLEGPGMRMQDMAPMECRTCHEVVSIDIGPLRRAEPARCASCGGTELSPWSFEAARCPRCGATMRETESGDWD